MSCPTTPWQACQGAFLHLAQAMSRSLTTHLAWLLTVKRMRFRQHLRNVGV